MQANLSKDIPGIHKLSQHDPSSAGPRMQAVAKTRHQCHYLSFAEKIRHMDTREKIFVSSDSEEAHGTLRDEFGDRIFYPFLQEYTMCADEAVRSKMCVQLALAEMHLLSKTKAFIYSIKSSKHVKSCRVKSSFLIRKLNIFDSAVLDA